MSTPTTSGIALGRYFLEGESMQKLEDIIWAWGVFVGRSHGTGCHFTQALNYGNASELNGNDSNGQPYHNHQCTATVLGMNYDDKSLPTNGSNVAYDLWYDNATDVNQTITFTASSETSQTLTWSITEALSLGLEINSTVGAPGIATSGFKETVTFSFSSTQGKQISDKQTWAVSDPVVVPAQKSVHCQMVIATQSYDINWTAPCLIKGSVAVWFDNRIDLGGGGDHNLWFVPIEWVLRAVQANNWYDTTGYTDAGNGIIATVRGNFSGSQGIRVDTKPVQTPLRDGTMHSKDMVMVPAAFPAKKTGMVTA
jgi:Clostridium epsilon toxin ETX/Bacillus mosquitocidal toxin MTX2